MMKKRNFLASSAATAGMLTILPRHVLEGSGYSTPSDKLC